MICLDTNAAIAVINGEAEVRRRLVAAHKRGEVISISVVVLFELLFVAEHSGQRERNMQRVDAFLAGDIEVLPFDAEDAFEAASIREELARIGRPIGPYDVLIAAQARRREATVVTANEGEFARVVGLKSTNWAKRS